MKYRDPQNHKTFVIAGIKNLLKRNYRIESDKIDLHALVDMTLTFSENWQSIKENYVLPIVAERLEHFGLEKQALENLIEGIRQDERKKTQKEDIKTFSAIVNEVKSLKKLKGQLRNLKL